MQGSDRARNKTLWKIRKKCPRQQNPSELFINVTKKPFEGMDAKSFKTPGLLNEKTTIFKGKTPSYWRSSSSLCFQKTPYWAHYIVAVEVQWK
jgi:hypothetical protein